MRLILLAAALACALAPVRADTLLWDNGDQDNRNWVRVRTSPEDVPHFARVAEIADDLQNLAEWKIAAISIDGLFEGLKPGSDDPAVVKKSDRIEVKIYRPDDRGGMPGEVFWSLTLEGDAAWDSQTFTGDPVNLGPRAFTYAGSGTANVEGLPVRITVEDPDGPIALPAGRWFVSWKVLEPASELNAERYFPFCGLTSEHPRPGFEDDNPLRMRDRSWKALRRDGEGSLVWASLPVRSRRAYNVAFKIYGTQGEG